MSLPPLKQKKISETMLPPSIISEVHPPTPGVITGTSTLHPKKKFRKICLQSDFHNVKEMFEIFTVSKVKWRESHGKELKHSIVKLVLNLGVFVVFNIPFLEIFKLRLFCSLQLQVMTQVTKFQYYQSQREEPLCGTRAFGRLADW